MQLLSQLLTKVKTISVIGNVDIKIQNVQFDSRKIISNSLFVATIGTVSDGHNFIEKAIKSGAIAIICQNLPDNLHANITYILVENAAKALGFIATNFYQNPSQNIKIVAITGTNGKTTNATLLYNLFRKLGYKVGMLSTVENLINDTVVEATHTTPDAIQLNFLMQKMVTEGCTHCFMEASSHAIDQDRMAGICLDGAVFTNITHDHLDYHFTFDAYIKAKKKLFDELPTSAFALTNIDDKRGLVMLQNTQASTHTFALKQLAEFKGKLLSCGLQGIEMHIDNFPVWFKLIGEFNAYNILGVYATAVLLGENKENVLATLSAVSGAKGRFETVLSPSGVIGIIDYAHTPDALENVLKTIQNLRTRIETVYCIVGCGGNRDAAKRPIMANIACKYADKVILTSDNPRNEDPEVILSQMKAGIEGQFYKKYILITDRLLAIKNAVSQAQKGDIILLAGKGHENYQEILGVKHPFDDKKVLEMEFSNAINA